MPTYDDIKVSEMTAMGIDDIPDTALIYIAIPGNTTPYKTNWLGLKTLFKGYSEEFVWDEDTNPDQAFVVPKGVTVRSVFLNRTLLERSEYILEDALDIDSITIIGTKVTIEQVLDPDETQRITIKS